MGIVFHDTRTAGGSTLRLRKIGGQWLTVCKTVEPSTVYREAFMGWVMRYVREDDGVDIVEYALIAAIVAIGCIVAMKDLNTGITAFFSRVTTGLAGIF